MGSVRVAIVGVGNCAVVARPGRRVLQGRRPDGTVPGLMHVMFGDYHVRDVEFVAAFDVDAKKVGLDLAEAISASENNTIKIADVPPTGITVQRGHTLDGLGKYYRETITESDAEPVDVVATLREAPSTSSSATCRWGPSRPRSSTPSAPSTRASPSSTPCPVFIAGDQEWADKFEAAGVPIIGDDIKCQVGATITHRVLAKLFEDRGVIARPDVPAQRRRQHGLQEHARARAPGVQEDLQDPVGHLASSRRATSGDRNVHIGPSDYVAWLDDRKWAYVRLEGRDFGDVPLNLEYKLEVWDSPELGRHHHRRDPRGEDRQGPRHRRPDAVGVVVLHEVAAGAAPRRRGRAKRRGLHPRRGGALSPRSDPSP